MAKTRHIRARMNQRGIRTNWIELVKAFGTRRGDKCILNKKACKSALRQLDCFRKEIIKLEEKGGLVVVEQNDADITAYRLDSYKPTRH